MGQVQLAISCLYRACEQDWFLHIQVVEKSQKKKNTSWHMIIIGNSNLGVQEYSFIGTQPCPLIQVLSMAIWAITLNSYNRVWSPQNKKYLLAFFRKSVRILHKNVDSCVILLSVYYLKEMEQFTLKNLYTIGVSHLATYLLTSVKVWMKDLEKYSSPPYPQGIHSKTPSGHLKPWIVPNLYILWFFLYIHA